MENDCYRHLLTPWTNLLSAACPPVRASSGERPDSHLKTVGTNFDNLDGPEKTSNQQDTWACLYNFH